MCKQVKECFIVFLFAFTKHQYLLGLKVKIILLIGIEALNFLLCIDLAYKLPQEKSEESTVRQRMILMLVCGGISVFNAINLQNLLFNNGVWIMSDLFLMLLFKCSKGRHNFIRGGIAILAKHLTIYMDYALGFLLIGNRNHSMRTVLYGKKPEIIGIFIIVRIMLLMVIIILTPKIRERFSDLRQTRRVLLVLDVTSYLGVLIFQQLFLKEVNQIYINSFSMTLLLGIIFCIVFYVYDLSAGRREKERLIRTTSRLLEENYRKLYGEQKRLEHTAHDFKNHIYLLTKYLEEEKYNEAIEYGRKLAGPLDVVSQRSWSGNKILDTILNTKLSEAEQKNIQVHMEVDNMVTLPLADYDLCIILSNLFDNAIEACEYVEKKEISISIKSAGALFIIKFVNSMKKKPLKKNHKYQTIKKDKEIHGIGLESVECAIEKYQGTLLLEHTENQFLAVVSLMGGRLGE